MSLNELRRPIVVAITLVALLFAPGALAAVDPRIHADAADCLTELGIDPSDGAERDTTCVVAYAHATEADRMSLLTPLTVQRPPDDIVRIETGPAQPSVTPYYYLPQLELFLLSGVVEYRPDGLVRHHDPPRLEVVPDVPWFFRVFATVDQTAVPWAAIEGADAGFMPCVHLEATVEQQLEDRVVLSRVENVVHLSRPNVVVPDMDCVEGHDFTIDEAGVTSTLLRLPPFEPVLGDAPRFVVNVRAYTVDEQGTKVMPQGLRWVHGPEHLLRLSIPTPSALAVAVLAPVWSEGQLHVGTEVASPWGHHDVNVDTLDLQVVEPDGGIVAARSSGAVSLPHVIFQNSMHGVHPFVATFSWDLLAADLPDGAYTLRVIAENSQNTAKTSAVASFTLSDGGSLLTLRDLAGNLTGVHRLDTAQEAPASLHALLLAAVLACVVVLRRRRR